MLNESQTKFAYSANKRILLEKKSIALYLATLIICLFLLLVLILFYKIYKARRSNTESKQTREAKTSKRENVYVRSYKREQKNLKPNKSNKKQNLELNSGQKNHSFLAVGDASKSFIEGKSSGEILPRIDHELNLETMKNTEQDDEIGIGDMDLETEGQKGYLDTLEKPSEEIENKYAIEFSRNDISTFKTRRDQEEDQNQNNTKNILSELK